MPNPADPDPIAWRPRDVARVTLEQWADDRWHVFFQIGEGADRCFKYGDFDARDDAWDYLLRGLGARSGPPPSHALDGELRTYRARLDELLGERDRNEGKWVVIKGDEVQWPFDSWEWALKFAYDTYGVSPKLVKRIERVETIHWI